MTNKNTLNIKAHRARARAAKARGKCADCNRRYCDCSNKGNKEKYCEVKPEPLTPADVKNIVLDCAEQLNLTNDTETKLIAENCIIQNAVDPLTPEQVKDIVITCVQTDAEIKALVNECLLANPSLTIEAVKALIEKCIEGIEIPDAVSDGHIKTIALQCILDNKVSDEHIKNIALSCFPEPVDPKPQILQCIFENQISDEHIKNIAVSCFPDPVDPKPQILECIFEHQVTDEHIKSIVNGCLPDPVDVKPIVLQCLIDNPQGLTEAQVKLIFDECIEGLVPSDDYIKCIFVECLSEWDIAPQCIKDFVCKCVIELLPQPLTKDDIRCYMEECYGHMLHTKAQIMECVMEALIAAPKPRTDNEIIEIVNDVVTDNRIKVVVLECLAALDGERWTEQQLINLINTLVKTDQQVKDIAQGCIDQAGILSETVVNALAKTVALQCIAEEVEVLDEADVKAIFIDCLKDLADQQDPVRAIDVDVICDANGILTIQVLNDDGTIAQGSGDLSKFFDYVEPEPTTVTFGYDPDTVYEENSQGNIELAFALKVINWDTDTFKHVDYNQTLKCLEIPYCGPTREDIKQCIADFNFSDYDLQSNLKLKVNHWESGTFKHVEFNDALDCFVIPYCGPTRDEIKECITQAIDDIPEVVANCLTSVNVTENNNLVTVQLNQANCDPVTFDFNVGTDGSVVCCNTSLVLALDGTQLTATLDQTNGPTLTDTISLSSLVNPSGDGCCNTAVVGSVDVPTKTAQIQVAQSNGDTFTATLELEPLLSSILTYTTATDPVDGCSQYQSVQLCGQEIGRVPLYTPMEKACKRVCVHTTYTGNQIIGPMPVDTVITIGNTTYNLPAGQVFNEQLTNVIGPIDICVEDVCDNDAFNNIATVTITPPHSCC